MANSQDVNIYHRILKLSPRITEPDAYELLGVPQFEPDQTKIKRAAMDRNALLQRLQNAENYEDVKRLEREVGQAMVRLTDPKQKADYDKGLSTSIFLMEPPPAPAETVTRSIAGSAESTLEMEILPDDPPPQPTSPIPASGIRMLPPPTKLMKSGKKSKKPGESDSKKFLPGEAPWQITGSWPGTRPWIVLGLGSGLCLMLFLGLLIAFWPASSKEEPASGQPASLEQPDSYSKTVAVSETPPASPIEPGHVEDPPGGSNFMSEVGPAVVVGPGIGNSSQAGPGMPTTVTGEPPGMQDVTSLQKWGECLAHANAVTQMEFSADGKSLITAGMDGMIRVWDAQTARQQHQISITPPAVSGSPSSFGIPGAPLPPGYSPAGMSPFTMSGVQSSTVRHLAVSQGNLLAATADGRTIQLWDIATAGNRGTIANSQDDYLWFGFSPAGDSFVTLNTRGILKCCSVTTGQSQMTEPISLQGFTAAAAPRAPLLMATGDLLGGITLWKTDFTNSTLPGTGTPALKMIFSPDGKLLASSDATGVIRILSTVSLKEIRKQHWPAFAVSDMRFTSDGRALLVLSADGMLRGLGTDRTDSADTGGRWKQTGGNLLAVSPDGKLLAVARGANGFILTNRGQLELWGAGAKPAAFHPQNYIPAASLPSKSTPAPMESTPAPNLPAMPLASSKAISAGNLDQIQELAAYLGHESSKRSNSVRAVEFHPDGRSFISGGSDSMAFIWNPRSNPPVKLQTLTGRANPILAVATSGSYAATGCSKGFIKLWDRLRGTDLNPDLKKPQHTGSVQDLAFSPNGNYLASVGQDKSVKIWMLPALTETVELPAKHKATVTGVTWIDDGQILTCDSANQFYQWKNLSLGLPNGLGGLGAPMGLGGFGVPQAGRAAGVPGLFGGIAPQLGQPGVTVLGNIKGFGFRINGIDSTQGNKAAFASDNGDIGLWNGRDEDPKRLEGHKKTTRCVAFSPDGSLLASAGGEDHAIRFWDADTGQSLHVLPQNSTPSQILSLDFSPDGRWLVTGDADGRLKLWGLP